MPTEKSSRFVRFYLWVKKFSIFYRSSGIFHNGSTKHVSACSVIMTTISLILMTYLAVVEFKTVNSVKDVMIYNSDDPSIVQ